MKYIYVITNIVNNKQYVGQHYTSANDGYMGSGTYLNRAIKKYGKENFKKEFIDECVDQCSANLRETYWMKEKNTLVPFGYNLRSEGEGHIITEEIRKNMRAGHKKLYDNGYIHPMKGKKQPEYLIALRRGDKNVSKRKDVKRKMSETRKKLFKTGKIVSWLKDKGHLISGDKNPNFGHKWTDEQKRAASERRRGKRWTNEQRQRRSLLYTGINNPNYKNGNRCKNG